MYSDTRLIFVMIVPPVILWFYDTLLSRAYQLKPSASFDYILSNTCSIRKPLRKGKQKISLIYGT